MSEPEIFEPHQCSAWCRFFCGLNLHRWDMPGGKCECCGRSERKFRSVWESCDLRRIENFMRELMQDLIAADSDIEQMILRGEREEARRGGPDV